MEPPTQQREVRIWLVPKELAVPSPGPSRCLVFGRDDEHRLAVHFEIKTLEPEPKRTLAGELRRRSSRWLNRRQFHLPNVHDGARLLADRLQCQPVVPGLRKGHPPDAARQENLKMARLLYQESEPLLSDFNRHFAAALALSAAL